MSVNSRQTLYSANILMGLSFPFLSTDNISLDVTLIATREYSKGGGGGGYRNRNLIIFKKNYLKKNLTPNICILVILFIKKKNVIMESEFQHLTHYRILYIIIISLQNSKASFLPSFWCLSGIILETSIEWIQRKSLKHWFWVPKCPIHQVLETTKNIDFRPQNVLYTKFCK